MNTNTISITRALAEIKSLDGRIEKAISSTTYIALVKGSGKKQVLVGSPVAVTTMSNSIEAAMQSITDMMRRRLALKSAIIASNGVTTVTIGGTTMTIAEAIERKSSIKSFITLRDAMQRQYGIAVKQSELANQKLADDIEKAVTAAYSNSDTKPSEAMYEAISAPRLAEHRVTLLDPLNVDVKLKKFDEEIETFLQEVDFSLSESNARTTITV